MKAILTLHRRWPNQEHRRPSSATQHHSPAPREYPPDAARASLSLHRRRRIRPGTQSIRRKTIDQRDRPFPLCGSAYHTSSPHSKASRSLPLARFQIASNCYQPSSLANNNLQKKSREPIVVHASMPHSRTCPATFFASGHSSGVPTALSERRIRIRNKEMSMRGDVRGVLQQTHPDVNSATASSGQACRTCVIVACTGPIWEIFFSVSVLLRYRVEWRLMVVGRSVVML